MHVKAKASKEWSHGQEFQSNQEVESQWGQGFSRDLQSHIVDGVPKANPWPSPEEKTEPEQWQECISKAKKARDQANSVLSDMESALHKAEGKKG